MKTVLVTGATGFIGRYVVSYLLSRGYSLITTATKERKEAEILYPLLKETKYISKNLNDNEENYFTFFNNPDCVIHLSWEGLPNYNELFHIEKNLQSNYSFIKNMIQHGLLDITVIGTCFEYGLQNGCLNEEMAPSPATVYGLAKDTLRKFIEILRGKYQFTMKWIRLFYLYGDGQGEKSLWMQLEKAIQYKQEQFNMSFGEQLRDYMPVGLTAEYISEIALQNKVTGIINCCSGKPVSVRDFVEEYFRKRNCAIKLNRGYYPYPEYEPFAFWGDGSKLDKIVGAISTRGALEDAIQK
jgi:dTDP-6-deoxy-L-talose 4-dehydrogenase (NAD+)